MTKVNEMTDNEITDADKKKIIALIHAIIPGCKIILFGSQARGTQRNSSDIDIALDAGYKLGIRELGEARGVLEASYVPYSFDIVDVRGVSTGMQESIAKEGKIWSM
jgi:predicted nucleotidyltransferase